MKRLFAFVEALILLEVMLTGHLVFAVEMTMEGGFTPDPSRHLVRVRAVSPQEADAILFSRSDIPASRIAGERSETDPTPEIEALAEALQNDPLLIADYVHNCFDYVPFFGSNNGAMGALLAGRGNDFDLTSLFIALVRQAGYSADYVIGDVSYSLERLANWVGVEAVPQAVYGVLASGGIPCEIYPSPQLSIVKRVWAVVEIQGSEYVFDPGMKEYTRDTHIDMNAIMEFDPTTLLEDAMEGAETGDNYVRNINESNIQQNLEEYRSNIEAYIREFMPFSGPDDVYGGRRIVRERLSSFPTELPFAQGVANEAVYSEIPAAYRTTVRIQVEGIDQVFDTWELASHRLAVTFLPPDYQPQLLLDGAVIQSGNSTTPGQRYPMTVSIDHPYAAAGGTYGDEEGEFMLLSGAEYALNVSMESCSADLIAYFNRILTDLQMNGGRDEEALLVSAAMIGQRYFYLDTLVNKLLGNLLDVVSVEHHSVGVVGQEDGYYISIPMYFTSPVSMTGNDEDRQRYFLVEGMISSAFEHGIFDQQQENALPAVSTTRLIQINDAASGKTFMTDAANWDSVYPNLDGYPQELLDIIESYLNMGFQAILPENGAILVNQWTGTGFILYFSDGQTTTMRMLVTGGLNGGHGTKPAEIDPAVENHRETNMSARDNDWQVMTSHEPVDMSTGAFMFSTRDISVGLQQPLGTGLFRYYSSDNNYVLGPFGWGWRHNYDMNIEIMSNPGIALGERSAMDMINAACAIQVLAQLLDANPTLERWLVSDIVAEWMMDSLTDNAVVVNLHDKLFMFNKLGENNYYSPPATGMRLGWNSDHYYFTDPDGNRFEFDPDNLKIRSWSDPNGNTMTFTYSDGLLETVTDAVGRALTFTYVDGLITQVTDFAGRTVSYAYTNQNLTSFTDAENNTWLYDYDSDNRLISITRPLGNTVVTNAYDDFGRVRMQTDANGIAFNRFYFSGYRNVMEDDQGNQTIYYYDGLGRLEEIIDPEMNSTINEYNGLGQIIAQVNPIGGVTRMEYHPETGALTRLEDPGHHVTRYVYTTRTPERDKHSLPRSETFYDLTRVEYPDGTFEVFTTDSYGNVTAKTDRAGKTSTQTYNSRGQVLTATNPMGGTIINTYNPDGTLQAFKDPETSDVLYFYDSLARLIREEYPDGTFKEFEYDNLDRKTRVTDERGNATVYRYDANGNLVRVEYADGNYVESTYDVMDRLVQIRDRRGKITTFTYDAQGRKTSETDPGGRIATYSYSPAGRPVRRSIGSHEWVTTFDAAGRKIGVDTPSGFHSTFEKDALGYNLHIVDPESNTLAFVRDSLERAVEISDPEGRTLTFDFNGWDLLDSISHPLLGTAYYQRNDLGHLTGIIDFNGEQWLNAYSVMGRLTSSTDPLDHVWSHTYDARMRLRTTTFPDGETMTLSYDDSGNLLQTSYSGGLTLNFTYDPHNDRMVSAAGLALGYDEAGHVISTTGDDSIAFTGTYDDSGRLRNISYADNLFTVTYQYDSTTGVLISVSDDLTGSFVNIEHDMDLRITGLARSNGVETVFSWDDASRLTRIRHGELADLQYTLNAAGDIIRISTTGCLAASGYITPQSDIYEYDAASQVASAGFSYDARGRLESDPDYLYTWDSAGRLTGISSIQLEYNGLNEVVRWISPGETLAFYYNHSVSRSPVVAEKDSTTGEWMRFYVPMPDGRLLYMIDAEHGNAVRFYHSDNAGNILFLTDAAGEITDSYAYSPYGEILAREGASEQMFTFSGEFGVWEVRGIDGIYNMRARYYDSRTCRFLSRDPLPPGLFEPETVNPYQYARLNPIRFNDSRGLRPEEITGAGTMSLFDILNRPVLQDDVDIPDGLGYYAGRFDGGSAASIGGLFGNGAFAHQMSVYAASTDEFTGMMASNYLRTPMMDLAGLFLAGTIDGNGGKASVINSGFNSDLGGFSGLLGVEHSGGVIGSARVSVLGSGSVNGHAKVTLKESDVGVSVDIGKDGASIGRVGGGMKIKPRQGNININADIGIAGQEIIGTEIGLKNGVPGATIRTPVANITISADPTKISIAGVKPLGWVGNIFPSK